MIRSPLQDVITFTFLALFLDYIEMMTEVVADKAIEKANNRFVAFLVGIGNDPLNRTTPITFKIANVLDWF